MQVVDLIEDLRRQGIQLRIENGKLCFHPKSAVTPEMLETLRQHKQQVLVYLIHEQGGVESLYANPPTCHNPFTLIPVTHIFGNVIPIVLIVTSDLAIPDFVREYLAVGYGRKAIPERG